MAEEQIPIGLRTCSVHPSRRFDLASLGLMRDAGFRLVELSFNRPARGVAHDDRVLAASFRRRAETWGKRPLSRTHDRLCHAVLPEPIHVHCLGTDHEVHMPHAVIAASLDKFLLRHAFPTLQA